MKIARTTIIREWLKLAPAERAAWSGFMRAHAAIVKELDAELEAAHGLPLSSYDVLLQLALAPEGRLQMFQLAGEVRLSRSGLSRNVERLEREGLVERSRGADPRAVFAVITEAGQERLRAAMPTHIDGVRRSFLDRLSPAQIAQLAETWDELLMQEREHDAT